MVEKFQTILSEIMTERGDVTLFALLKMDEFVDKWTVVFSATWANDANRSEVFELIRQKIINKLTHEEIGEIARIAIYSNTEHLIQELLQYQSGATLENKKINGNVVHFAHILRANLHI